MSAKRRDGPAILQGMRAGGVVRIGLVVVGEQQQIVAAVADVGDVDQHVADQLALYRDVPALHRAGVEVVRHVGDVGRQRVELRRIGQARRVSLLRRHERRSARHRSG